MRWLSDGAGPPQASDRHTGLAHLLSLERIVEPLWADMAGQPHTTIKGGGHFLQEEKGEELAGIIVHFIARTK